MPLLDPVRRGKQGVEIGHQARSADRNSCTRSSPRTAGWNRRAGISAECIGIYATTPGTRFEAVEPLRRGVRAPFRDYTVGVTAGLTARHDHGRQDVGDSFQGDLRFLGIVSSQAFVRAPEGNGVAERFIRTLKEPLLWVQPFDTVETLRQALHAFQDRYHEGWLSEHHGHHTPAQVRARLAERAT